MSAALMTPPETEPQHQDVAEMSAVAPDETRTRERRWRCACGQSYRYHGSGRHRIYWPLGAGPGEAVLDGCCIGCGDALPGKRSTRGRASADPSPDA